MRRRDFVRLIKDGRREWVRMKKREGDLLVALHVLFRMIKTAPERKPVISKACPLNPYGQAILDGAPYPNLLNART